MMTPQAPARPDQRAYDDAVRAEPSVLVAQLRGLLGVRLVAVIAGVRETRAVHEWAEGSREIRNPVVLPRLRLAYQVAAMIADAESPAIAQAWMQGLNPLLDDQSPALLLRADDSQETGQRILAAARTFAANG
ncbi:hypothetical protein [Tomitella gaofuii]|uniref:hypothetical protein n=1 Tax=Tomitella gaofuii TaxID=2760083 RepID=UPI003558B684